MLRTIFTPGLATPAAAATGALLLATALAACASLGGGEKGGGGENLPNRGVTGYAIPTDDEGELLTLALSESADAAPLDLHSPSAHVLDDGRVVLYVEAAGTAADAPTRVLRTESLDGETFSAPAQVLGPEIIPGGARAPSIARRPDGGGFRMVFASADGSALWAVDSDDGLVFDAQPQRLLEPLGVEEAGGLGQPALVFDDDGREVLFYEAHSQTDPIVTTIRRASRTDASAAFERDGLVLAPGTGCVDGNDEEVRCWDAGIVGAPEVVLSTNSLGERLWRLAYHGGSGGSPAAIGFAFSFDGRTWSRFPYNPALRVRQTVVAEPSNVRLGERFLLFVTVLDGAQGVIAAAVSDSGSPSETF